MSRKLVGNTGLRREGCAGQRKTRHDRVDRRRGHFGDLAVGDADQLPQDDDFAKLHRQEADRLQNSTPVGGLAWILQINQCLLLSAPGKLGVADTSDDAEQPGLDVVSAPAVELSERAPVAFFHDTLSVGAALHQKAGERERVVEAGQREALKMASAFVAGFVTVGHHVSSRASLYLKSMEWYRCG
jgi:hypothetical protein